MDTQWGRMPSVFIRWDVFLTLFVITVTRCSALESCPFRSCRTCGIEYLTCKVKCCQTSIYIYCCGNEQDEQNQTQDERPSNFPVSIVFGMGTAIVLISLLICLLCLIHAKKAKARRIRTHCGANRGIQRTNRNGQEPMALENSLEMCVIRNPPPYVKSPPPYGQTESDMSIYGTSFENVQIPGSGEEISRSHSTLPPPYSEITLTAPRDTTLQRY